MLRLNPVLDEVGTYPFTRLTDAKARAAAAGADLIDFGVGEPREETPELIRRALADAIEPLSAYPLAAGLPELRAAIARWAQGRFGAALDPDTEVVPTLGSKEAVFHLAQVLGGSKVVVTAPGYPVPERGARFAGKAVVRVPVVPDLDAIDWTDVAILWLNFPNNPTGLTAPEGLYARAAELAREHGFVLASDEAYSELFFGAAPRSALELADRRNVVVFNTLSKRSSMPGYRSGFAAGDPELIGVLKRYRPNVGVAPQTFVQRASIAAWDDEAHVEEVRERYRAKRDVLLPALEAAGLRLAGGDATFFLWLAVPDGEEDEAYAFGLLDRLGVVAAPGSFFGPEGAGHVRFALVPPLERCREAAARLAS